MEIFETFKNGFNNAVDTISRFTQNLVEKNRLNAQLSRLRTLMKAECEISNRAYIALGKKYYGNKVNGSLDECENEEVLFDIIKNSNEQIKKLRKRYRVLVKSKSVDAAKKFDDEYVQDINEICPCEDENDTFSFEEVEKDDKIVTNIDENVTNEEVAEEDAF